jgi:hypothetical protein
MIRDHNSDGSTAETYQEILGSLQALRQASTTQSVLQTLPSPDDLSLSQTDSALVGRYRRMIGLGNRTFFSTVKYYFGLATYVPQPADEVWTLEDATTPFLLRRLTVEGEFTVVSEVYVHGIMQGEVPRGKGQPDWKPIWLK